MFALKPKKLTFSNFGNLRKKKQEDGEEYVCPMELGHASGSSSQKGFRTGLDMRLYEEDDLDRLEQVSPAPCTHRHSDAPWKLCTLTHEVCRLHMPERKIVTYRNTRRLPPASRCCPQHFVYFILGTWEVSSEGTQRHRIPVAPAAFCATYILPTLLSWIYLPF